SDASKQQSLSVAARAEVERLILGADEPTAALTGLVPDTRPVVLPQNPVGSLDQLPNDVVPELKMAASNLRRERLATTTAWAQWLPAPYVDYRMLQWGGSSWNPEAVQWKVGMAIPLFNQKARADLVGAQARLRAAEAQAAATQNQIDVLRRQLAQQVVALNAELNALIGAESAAYALLQQERRRFSLGESTMFILASRETKYLEAVQKRAIATAKLQSLEAERRLLTRPSL
ncbi:MAG: TolC family protein, partial [Bacteroidota bacterium]